MVPNGWKKESLSDVTAVIDCKHRTPIYVEAGIPLVSPGTIKWGALDLVSPVKRVSKDEYESLMDHCTIDTGDLVMSRNQSVGIASYVETDEPFVLGQDTVLIKPKKVDSKFVFYKLQSEVVQRSIIKLAGGSTFSRINLADIRKLKLNFPPLPEQKKIAQILSTWDKAITTTEQLLYNSKLQKKALMQQLLTSKKRFPRFEGIWKKYTLGELGDTFNGLTGKTKDDFGFGKKYIPYINIFKNSRIDVSALELVDVKEGESQSLSQYGDIFFTTSSETPDEVGMSSVLLDHVDELYLNSFCFGYRLFGFESLHPEFAQYLLRSEHVRGEIAVLGQGATRYNLSKKQLMKLEITLPLVDEQKKIASVLSCADQEIESLKSQLDGLKQEKKSLMQQLLTGKRRVKIDNKEVA